MFLLYSIILVVERGELMYMWKGLVPEFFLATCLEIIIVLLVNKHIEQSLFIIIFITTRLSKDTWMGPASGQVSVQHSVHDKTQYEVGNQCKGSHFDLNSSGHATRMTVYNKW